MTDEVIVLVHGLWMNGLDMQLLRVRLARAGYTTVLFRYATVRSAPADNARRLHRFAHQLAARTLHFVGHSLGGLVIRHLFDMAPDLPPGRVVTLGTPHRGSSAAAALSRLTMGRLLLGQSLDQGLLGGAPGWSRRHELGSIAGSLRFGLGLMIPGIAAPSDGTVSVAETVCTGMQDHAVVGASHFGLLLSAAAARQCLAFLRHGRFDHLPFQS